MAQLVLASYIKKKTQLIHILFWNTVSLFGDWESDISRFRQFSDSLSYSKEEFKANRVLQLFWKQVGKMWENISIEMVTCLQIKEYSILLSQLKLKKARLVNLICPGSEIKLKWLLTDLLVGHYEMIEKPRTYLKLYPTV